MESLRRYLFDELNLEVSELQAGFLMEYFLKEIGPFAYNQGVEDAGKFFTSKIEDLGGICFKQPLTHWMGSGSSNEVRRKPG